MHVIHKETKQVYTRMRKQPRSSMTPERFTVVQLFTADEEVPHDPEYGEVYDITHKDQHLLQLVLGNQVKFKVRGA